MSDGHKISRPIQVCPANPLETEEQREYPSHRWTQETVQISPPIIRQTCRYCGLTETIGDTSKDKANWNPHIEPSYWQKLVQEAQSGKEG